MTKQPIPRRSPQHPNQKPEQPTPAVQPVSGFTALGVDQQLVQLLDRKKITNPSQIQHQAIPVALNGEDCIGIAQTGTGKTLAFVLPLMQQLQKGKTQTLIVVPTRELAFQIQEVTRWFERALRIRSSVVIGGASMGKQIQELRARPDIIIATPGRLIDHLEQKKVRLDAVSMVILDEADRMFDMGFSPQIKKIFAALPPVDKRQTMLFSATMPDAITKLVHQHMHEPTRVEVAVTGTVADGIAQEIVILDNDHKKPALVELIKAETGLVIVFTRTKHRARQLNEFLRKQGQRSEELHGNRSLAQRKKAVAAIHSGRSRILVATDIAARGIDISDVALVINFDLPDNPEDYVHRIGRTGRAGSTGRAISFLLDDQEGELKQIQLLIKDQITRAELQTVPSAQLKPGKSAPRKRSGGGGGGARRQAGGRGYYGKPRSGGGGQRRSGAGSARRARYSGSRSN